MNADEWTALFTGVSILVAAFALFRAEVANRHARLIDTKMLKIAEDEAADRIASLRRGELTAFRTKGRNYWEITVKNVGMIDVRALEVFVNEKPLQELGSNARIGQTLLEQVPEVLCKAEHFVIKIEDFILSNPERVFFRWVDESGTLQHQPISLI